MENVTLTKLYEVLAQKVGRNEAECLTQYVDIKVKNELNSKTEILATKVLVKDETQSLRLAFKEDIQALRSELKGDLHALRNELKGDLHALRNEVTAGIHTLRNEMKEHSLSQQKWMLGIIITVVIMILGLYAKH